ncbi:MAG TPA: hypothetical protein VFU22_34520, partial [Roseiflexaceae bacterium]|nr:hypothetical protein [Roseiflexaceae bacterium]
MLAFLVHSSSSATISSAASGWDLLIANPGPADYAAWCYKRVYQAGDSNPTWTFSTAGNWVVDIVAYSGADATTPIDGSGGNQSAAVNTKTTASLTPSVTGCMLVAHGSVDASGSARTWTESGAMTERVEAADNQIHRVIAEELLSTSGSGVTRDLTVSGSAQDLATLAVLIKPSSSGTTFPQSAAGTLTTAGANVKQTGKILAGTLASAGALTKQAGANALGGTLTTAAAVVKQTQKTFAGVCTPAGALTTIKAALLSINAMLTTAGVLSRRIDKALAGVLDTAAGLSNRIDKVFVAALAPAGALAATKTALLSITGTLTTAGALIKESTKGLTGALAMAGALTKSIGKLLSGAIGFLGGLVTSSGAAAPTVGTVA